MALLINCLFGVGVGINVIGLALALKGADDAVWYGSAAIASTVFFVAEVLAGIRVGAVIQGTIAAIYAYLWWKNRRNGRWRKAARELGAKSAARVKALVDQMTPSPIPSPVGAS